MAFEQITVNKKMMNFYKDNETYSLPCLCDVNKMGKECFWEIYVVENNIFRKSYQKGGKIREFPITTSNGKNIGKKNETTDHEQALFDAYGMWTKKQDQGYKIYEKNTDESHESQDSQMVNENTEKSDSNKSNKSNKSNDSNVLLPMLANKYSDKKHKLSVPFAVSPKLDGIRVICHVNKKKELVLLSRLGKEFSFLDNIRNSLRLLMRNYPNVMIDGELYSHDLAFNVISGVVRAKKTKSKYDDQIELWIFDLIDMTDQKTKMMGYGGRMKLLKKIEEEYNCKGGQPNLKFVYYETCENHEDIVNYHSKYITDGFEGIMCRNFLGPYLFKNRSSDLLKYKAFEDAEFKIIGAKTGKSTESGAIVFECESKGGEFDVRPRGSIEKRRQMYKDKNKYIGKLLTVRYQPCVNEADQEVDTGIPRFPVGIDIRDYE